MLLSVFRSGVADVMVPVMGMVRSGIFFVAVSLLVTPVLPAKERKRKRADNVPEPERQRSLDEWLALSRESLEFACRLANLEPGGTDEELANVLFTYHQQQDGIQQQRHPRFDPYAYGESLPVTSSVSGQGEAVAPNEDVINDILRLHEELGTHAGSNTGAIATTAEAQAFPRVRAHRVGGSTWSIASTASTYTVNSGRHDTSLPPVSLQPTSILSRFVPPPPSTQNSANNPISNLLNTVNSLQGMLTSLLAGQGTAQQLAAQPATGGFSEMVREDRADSRPQQGHWGGRTRGQGVLGSGREQVG